jgi:hypothetical protein
MLHTGYVGTVLFYLYTFGMPTGNGSLAVTTKGKLKTQKTTEFINIAAEA